MLEVSKFSEAAPYGEEVVPFFIPSLVAILAAAERRKGVPLTQAEVLTIRDESTVVIIPRPIAEDMVPTRGYKDIDPENCWSEWQHIRLDLTEPAEPSKDAAS